MRRRSLVLGAGASYAYGYPLGGHLRKQILEISTNQATAWGILNEHNFGPDNKHFDEFRNAFRYSQMYSIDAFLARRLEYVDIGKRCIAGLLLQLEDKRLLFEEQENKDHWYQYLVNQIAQSEWDELDLSWLSIITFNYDRSLEHFLHDSLVSIYGKESHEVMQKLSALRILHVYGALGETFPNAGNSYREYNAAQVSPAVVREAAKKIEVVPEGRDNSEALVLARQWLSKSDGICFLGFGFDALNVARLAADGACAALIQRSNGHQSRPIFATYFGMTKLEFQRAYSALTNSSTHDPFSNALSSNCTTLLREKLFLSG